MLFSEAMKEVIKGARVTRRPWLGTMYFERDKDNQNDIVCFQSMLAAFHYDDSIMISNDWLIEGCNEPLYFYDIVNHLQSGKKATLSTWEKDTYIYYDSVNKYLVMHQMHAMPYIPDFDSFIANDWEIV